MTGLQREPAADKATLRLLGSLGIALCVVVVMLWLALTITGYADRGQRARLDTHAVSPISDAERRELGGLLEPRRGPGDTPGPAPLAGAEGYGVPPATRGVVALDVRVDATGAVTDVRVIDASPPGIYESQAVAEVRRRSYEPEVVGGRAVPSRRLETVDFTIAPADGPALGRD